MEGKRLIQSIRLRNVLSFGSAGQEIALQPLNVLIGPNAAGKSNLIEVLSLLQAAPKDLAAPIHAGGGIAEWLWKGANRTGSPVAELDATINYPGAAVPLRYRLQFTLRRHRMEIVDEAVENNERRHPTDRDVYFFYRYQQGRPVLNVRTELDKAAGVAEGRQPRSLQREDINPEQSVLSQRKDPDQYPELTYLSEQFASMLLYREFNLGRSAALRKPQLPDLRSDVLADDGRNLALVLNNLQRMPATRQRLLTYLRKFYAAAEDFLTIIQGGTVQLFIQEHGLHEPIPASRLSDGTLRYLCLLAILFQPEPPPLVCIEEPELGLHPDIIPTVAQLLMEAAERTQLIVTTHSDTLVSALSEVPEAVVVCEPGEDGTVLRRLDGLQLAAWLEKYSLGDLWSMGELGGTRW